jgi:hypothetical protein
MTSIVWLRRDLRVDVDHTTARREALDHDGAG